MDGISFWTQRIDPKYFQQDITSSAKATLKKTIQYFFLTPNYCTKTFRIEKLDFLF